MKKIILAIIVLIFGPLFSELNSQDLPKKVLFKPKIYEKPVENNLIGENELSTLVWTVFSDRSSNITYTEPGSGIEKFALNFMDAFYVLQEKDGFLRLIQPELVTGDGYVKSDAKDYGWIRKEELLLWTNCLVTDNCNLDRKAMILNTIDAYREKIEDVEFAKFYFDPMLKNATGKKSSVYKIYFVYKTNENSVLLGRKSKFNSTISFNTIVGWVKKSRITPWDHRLAIEPNWKDKAVSERKRKNVRLRFFDDKKAASEYFATGDTLNDTNLLWKEFPYSSDRKIGYYPRFPILSEEDENIMKVGIIDEMTSEYGFINEDSAIIAIKKIEDWAKAKKNINFVFVVDGSTSMQPYFEPVANAIENSMKELSEKTNNLFRFAAVVYRDSGEMERTIEPKSLTQNYKDVVNFLDNITAKNVFDLDEPEAVNLGLKEAVRGVGLSKKETNVIVLIGDAGNHHRDDETQVKQDEIINLIDKYECHLLVFQVQHGSHPTYNEFNEQAKSIILDLATRKQDSIKKLGVNLHTPEFLPPQNGVFELNESAIVASLVTCEPNKSVSPNEIETQVEGVIFRINKFIDDLRDMQIAIIREGGEYASSSLGPAFLYALKNAGLSDEEIKFYCAKNSQMYYEGYGSINNLKVNNPLANYVLFMDKVELTELLRIFDNLLNATSYNDKRRKMKDTWFEILRKHIGNSDEVIIENINLGEISSKILCLPKSTNLLKIPIKDITDPKKFSDYDFNNYVKSIREKSNELKKIFNNKDYKYSFESDDKTYYWIEENLLP